MNVLRCCLIVVLASGFSSRSRLLLAAPPPADSPTASDAGVESGRALRLREQGNQAMLDMRYVDALALYQQSQALDPDDAGVNYSIARARQLLGDFPEALDALERFDRAASAEVKGKVGRLEALFAELRSRISTLHFRCNQDGARVLIDNRVIGTTPLPKAVRLPAGVALVQVELDGFFPARRSVVLPAAGALDLELTLHARSRAALLFVQSLPAGASLFLDGGRVGTATPRAELVLPAGSHRLVARRGGYDEASLPIVLNAGSSREVTVVLEPSVPITSRWWFWTGSALIVAGGAALAVALLTERDAGRGTLPPGQVRAPFSAAF